jgi:hypothetical protein
LRGQTLARGWHGEKKKPFVKKPFASSRTDAASSSGGKPPWQKPTGGSSFFKSQSSHSGGTTARTGTGTGGAGGGDANRRAPSDRRPASGQQRRYNVRYTDQDAGDGAYSVCASTGIGGDRNVLSTSPNVPHVPDTHTHMPPMYLDTVDKRDAFECFDVCAATSDQMVPIWIPPSIPIFEDLAEVKDLLDVNLLHDIDHNLYVVLDSACAKMCCGTNWLSQASQRLDSLGLAPVQVPTADPFRFGISTCWSVGRAYLPLAIRGVPIILIPSLIAQNPDLCLLASLEFMEAVGLQLDVAGKRCNMTKLGLYNVALRKTPQGHLAVNITGYPEGGFPRDFDTCLNEASPSEL